MPTYNEVLTQVQRLALSDQLRLLEELRKIVDRGVEVEGDDEVVSAQEIAESQAALADYFAGRDRGISSKELKLKLFGEKSDGLHSPKISTAVFTTDATARSSAYC